MIKVIKSKMMKWACHIARVDGVKYVYKTLVGKPDGKRPLRRPMHRW